MEHEKLARVDARRIQWLLERFNAKADWITDAQAESFGRRPEGPIMPTSHTVLESILLPTHYGVDKDGKRFSDRSMGWPPRAVMQVAVNLQGECFLLAHHVGGYLLDRFDLQAPWQERTKTVLPFGTYDRRGKPTPYDNTWTRIIGFTADGTPVIYQRSTTYGDGEPKLFTSVLWRGDKQIPHPLKHSTRGVARYIDDAWMTRDGHVLSSLRGELPPDHCLCRDGEEFSKLPPQGFASAVLPQSMAMDTEGRRFILYRPDLVRPDRALLAGEGDSWYEAVEGYNGYHFHELVDTREGLVVVGMDRLKRARAFKVCTGMVGKRLVCTFEDLHTLGSADEYRRGYLPLTDEMCAYVRSSRDGMEQWAFRSGKDQLSCGPSFDRVSELFRNGDFFHYWAVADRHLYLMMIPDVPAIDL